MTEERGYWQRRLAADLARARGEAPPEEAIELASMALVDLVGVTLAGAADPFAGVVTEFCAANGARGPARVIGTAIRTGVPDAAMANAAIGHVLDYDDSNFVLGGHPTVVIMPALLALGQARRVRGEDVLAAYVTGFEAVGRIARAVNFHHYEKGWHPTATLGVFGAAAGSAHLLRLDEGQMAHALGLAAAMSSGLKASFGSMAKPLQVGHAARSGVVAALMAEAGVTAGAQALEAPSGFFAVHDGIENTDPEALGGRDQPELLVSRLKFKRYPCCGSTHVVIDTARQLRAVPEFRLEALRDLEVAINPRRRPHVDRPRVRDPLEGKFSVQYTAAAAIVDGHVGIEHFTEAAVARSDLRAVMARVRVVGIEEPSEGLDQPCRIRATQEDGRQLDARLEGPLGRDPADYAAFMAEKFLDCAGGRLGRGRAEAALRDLLALRTLADIRDVVNGLAPGASRSDVHVLAPKEAQDV